MENTDKIQQNLAGNEMKAKKGWKKPELKILNINKTNQDVVGHANDGMFTTNANTS
jgi:hypothetical protein